MDSSVRMPPAVEPCRAADGLVRVYPADAAATAPTAALVWVHGGGFAAGANVAAGSILRMLARAAVPTNAIIDFAGGAPAPGATPEVAQETRAPSAKPDMPAGVFLAYPTLLAVQPAPDAALRALLDANPEADTFGPTWVREMYEGYLGAPVDEATLPAVPGLAASSDVAVFPPVLMVNSEADELRVSGEAFASTLAEAGVPIERVTEPRIRHGHLNRPRGPAASATIDRVVRRIDGLDQRL